MKNCRYSACTLSVIGILLIYAGLFFFVDKPIAYASHALSGTFIYKASHIISLTGSDHFWLAISLVLLVIIGLIRLSTRRVTESMQKILFVSLSVVLASVIGIFLKMLLGRYRPELLFSDNLYGFHFFALKDSMHSSPSGHSLCIFALVTSLSMICRRSAPLLFAFAILVAASRVILTKHFVSDVVLGAYIGIISAFVMQKMLNVEGNLCCVK